MIEKVLQNNNIINPFIQKGTPPYRDSSYQIFRYADYRYFKYSLPTAAQWGQNRADPMCR